ncbi:MAG: CPBP family intramembrane glutamic endopeptidase [Ruminiclostridium sp.]
MKDEKIKKSITIFLILVFVLPLICVFLIKNFSIFQSGMLNFIMYGIEAMTPSLAALITTGIFAGSKGIQEFIKKCYFDNIKMRYIALAVILPLAVLTITKATWLIFIEGIPFIEGISARKLIIVMWALIAEELGWRGFLQGKLDKRCGHIATPVLIGIIWALWHYHFFWLGTTSAPLILFAIGCIAESFCYYWLTKKSEGNIIPASIWHFVGNLFIILFLISPQYNQGSIVPYLLFVVYLSLMALGIIKWGTLSKKEAVIKISDMEL